jgi:hypothetical protein
MVMLCGARLIWEVAYRRPFLPFFTDECTKLEVIALPCENAQRDKVKHILMTTLYLHERYSN